MSRLTVKNLIMAFVSLMAFTDMYRISLPYLLQSITKAKANPAYCATRVPMATPSTFMPKTLTRVMLAAMFIMFCTIEMTMGVRVFCMPIYQPVRL